LESDDAASPSVDDATAAWDAVAAAAGSKADACPRALATMCMTIGCSERRSSLPLGPRRPCRRSDEAPRNSSQTRRAGHTFKVAGPCAERVHGELQRAAGRQLLYFLNRRGSRLGERREGAVQRGQVRARNLVARHRSRQRRLEELRLLLFDDRAERLAQGAERFVVQPVEAAGGGGGGGGNWCRAFRSESFHTQNKPEINSSTNNDSRGAFVTAWRDGRRTRQCRTRGAARAAASWAAARVHRCHHHLTLRSQSLRRSAPRCPYLQPRCHTCAANAQRQTAPLLRKSAAPPAPSAVFEAGQLCP
jgi:hypothetical protein